MGIPTASPRIDERAMGAGTTVRLALLVLLLLAAGGAMLLPALNKLSSGDQLGCKLAAGLDPDRADMASAVNSLTQAVPFEACVAKYAPPPPLWQLWGWPVLLAAAAVVLFFLLPAWKVRRSRAVPLDAVDEDDEHRVRLAELATTAGLPRLPRVVVDRRALTTGAVVFGRSRRPVLCLDGGLLATRRSAPERFRAVVLHEFAHVANRDVTLTYGTVALWRVFLALVLVPYLVWESTQVHAFLKWEMWSTDTPVLVRQLLLPAVMVALVYLARTDVLRSREVYADLTAVRWGAHPRGWDVPAQAPAGRGLRRALASLRKHWDTHPRWEERHDALADPAPLFGTRALPMFLTGVAAAMANVHLLSYLSTYNMYTLWRVQLVSLVPAALVAGVIGTALWRAVAYAVLKGRPVPSGVRTGLWLGAGLGTGGLFTGQSMGNDEWLPQRPVVLLLAVAAGLAFAWWVTQCAHLWAGTWRGRSLRPPLLIGLASAALVLSAWFAWWVMDGASWAAGSSYSSNGVRQTLLYLFPGSSGGARVAGTTEGIDTSSSALASAVVTVWPALSGFIATPLMPAAAVVLWLLPLAAWLTSRPTGVLRWVTGALSDGSAGEPPAGKLVPPLRKVLAPGLLGGAASWLALAGAQTYLHASRPGPQQRPGVYEVRYLALLFLAMMVPATVAALVAAMRTDRGRRLAGALIAAGSATVLAIAGMVLFVSADGCIGPLNTLESSCSWRPAWQVMQGTLPRLVNSILVLAAVLALLVAAVCSLYLRARARWMRPVSGVGEELTRLGARPTGSRGFGVRLVAGVCVAGAVGIAVLEPVKLARLHTMVPGAALTQSVIRQGAQVAPLPVSVETRARQVHAWHRLGGRFLLENAKANYDNIQAVLRTASESKNANLAYLARVRPACADFGRIAGWVNGAYFRVPDPAGQLSWQALGTLAQQGSLNCERALDRQDSDLFIKAMSELIAAGNSAASVSRRVATILREAGYEGY
ncbi:M48 family metalloprotease [Streptomyces sp. NPDC102441]|uniref:M48 family metalloprotease n=1 Tax=Streptomyces sp. NPDC102441 TaxID=3366176 RepID=UPI00382A8846